MVARVVIWAVLALTHGALASSPVSAQANNYVIPSTTSTYTNPCVITQPDCNQPTGLLQSMLSPAEDILGKITTFDNIGTTNGIQPLTAFGADVVDASENEARLISQFQENLKSMYNKVKQQEDKLAQDGEQILKLQKIHEMNKMILAKNREIVKEHAAELVKLVTKYTAGLDMGSSSSGAGAAAPAFMEKLGRLKDRASTSTQF